MHCFSAQCEASRPSLSGRPGIQLSSYDSRAIRNGCAEGLEIELTGRAARGHRLGPQQPQIDVQKFGRKYRRIYWFLVNVPVVKSFKINLRLLFFFHCMEDVVGSIPTISTKINLMKRFGFGALLVSLAGIILPALVPQDVAPDTQTGNFLYKTPTGWKPVEKGDTTIIYAPAPPPGTSTYIALAANDMEGDLQNSFSQLWGGFKNSYRILQGGQPLPLHAKNGYDAYYTTAVALDQGGNQWSVYVMGAQYKKHVQVVMFMSNVPVGTMLSAYQKVFQQTFLASLSFGDALPGSKVPAIDVAVAEETPHKLPPGALEGIYIGFTITSGHAGLRRLHFNPDGWVVKDVLQEGMIGFDFTGYRNDPNTNRSWVGRYRVNGNTINILWQDYAEDREVIKRNENSYTPGIDTYIPMCRCTGKKFSGKYNWGLAGSGQYLQFSTDGTFLDHGVLDQMLVPNPHYDHPRTQRGTYTIQSQTIIFNFADGRRGMRTFYAPKAQEKGDVFDFVGLGWHTLYEEHHVNEP